MIDPDKEDKIPMDKHHVKTICDIINSGMQEHTKLQYISAKIRNNSLNQEQVFKVVETLLFHRFKKGAIKNV